MREEGMEMMYLGAKFIIHKSDGKGESKHDEEIERTEPGDVGCALGGHIDSQVVFFKDAEGIDEADSAKHDEE